MKAHISLAIQAHLIRGTFYLLLVAPVIPFASARANTITVTNTNDSGPGSLRQALADANDGDTIGFAVTGTISLTGGELVIDKNIIISGPGPGLLVVARSQQAADFRIFNIPPSHTAEIDGLTITGGSLVGNGGGISSGATLTISNCAISGNSITANGVGYSGAGIYNVGNMTVVNSIVNNNQALIVGFFPPNGGGISNDGGTLTIQNTTISENSVAASGWGGGVSNTGSLTAISSTIRGNTASAGGGIAGGGATIINCTINGNSAVFEGGGIFGGGTISNSTISGNTATGWHGAAIFQTDGNITITNIVVVNNLSGAAPVFSAARLVPGEVATFTGSYLAPTNCSSASTSSGFCGILSASSSPARRLRTVARHSTSSSRLRGKIRPLATPPRLCPARPTRCSNVAMDRVGPSWQTKSTEPMSIPSSSDAVATSAFPNASGSRSARLSTAAPMLAIACLSAMAVVVTGLRQGPGHDRAHLQQVLPRGELGHHAAEGPMDGVLALPHQRFQHRAPGRLLHHRGGAVVAGGFQAEDQHPPSVSWPRWTLFPPASS